MRARFVKSNFCFEEVSDVGEGEGGGLYPPIQVLIDLCYLDAVPLDSNSMTNAVIICYVIYVNVTNISLSF